MSRAVCARCRRPVPVCYCAHLVSLPARTRVVFVQHPREARVPIGTARMAHLMLENSELHRGVQFDAHPRVRQLAEDPGAALLFPGPGDATLDPALLCPGDVRTLVVVDGTWAQARKLLKQNPLLARLPRIGLAASVPGNYRIRREPAAECLATIEAVSRVLGLLEGAPDRFAAMLAAFTFMVDRQIELAGARTEPPRRWHSRPARERAEARLREELARAVVVHAEVNSHPRWSGTPGQPELLQLVARRMATGDFFQAIIAPRRPLAASVPHHLGLSEDRLRAGEPIAAALSRWRAFLLPGDVQCGWGSFTRDRLLAEGLDAGGWLDLRALAARRLQTSPGGPLEAARLLGAGPGEGAASGRAGRTVAGLEAIVAALLPDVARGTS